MQRKSHSVGTIFKYKCNKGYRLVGSSTAYCTPTGWSVGEAPICARPGCDKRELLGNGMEYGHSKSMYGGAVFRFSCSSESVMRGNPVVVCDGESWNGTKPECLTASQPPSLSVIVDSVQVENPSVSLGQEVTLICHSLGGNPVPTVAFYMNDQKVGEEGLLSGVYTFTASQHHDGMRIYCGAWNSFYQYPVHSLYQVITIKYAPSSTYIRGKTSADPEEHVQYTCTSAVSDPASDMSVRVTDQNGDVIKVAVKKMPVMTSRKGFTSRISFEVDMLDAFEHVDIECIAENDVGKARSTHRTVVTYPSTTTSNMDKEDRTVATLEENKDQRIPVLNNELENNAQETETEAMTQKTEELIESTKNNEVRKESTLFDGEPSEKMQEVEENKAMTNTDNIVSQNEKEHDVSTMPKENEEISGPTTEDINNKPEVYSRDENQYSQDKLENVGDSKHEHLNENIVDMEDEKHENLVKNVQPEAGHDDYSSYEDRSSELYDDYMSDYLEESEENYDDYISDYLESSQENAHDFISEYQSGSKETYDDDYENDAVDYTNTAKVHFEENNTEEEEKRFHDFNEKDDEELFFRDLESTNSNNREGTFVQLSNDYDDISDASDFFDESKRGSEEDNDYQINSFRQEAVDEPAFQKSESGNSHIALKSSMNIENAAQVSEMVFPVSSGRQLIAGFYPLILLICILTFSFYLNLRLIQ